MRQEREAGARGRNERKEREGGAGRRVGRPVREARAESEVRDRSTHFGEWWLF